MNTDAVLRMLIGVLGLMPTTFFLMQTLKWRGSITKVLILQISFNVLIPIGVFFRPTFNFFFKITDIV